MYCYRFKYQKFYIYTVECIKIMDIRCRCNETYFFVVEAYIEFQIEMEINTIENRSNVNIRIFHEHSKNYQTSFALIIKLHH